MGRGSQRSKRVDEQQKSRKWSGKRDVGRRGRREGTGEREKGKNVSCTPPTRQSFCTHNELEARRERKKERWEGLGCAAAGVATTALPLPPLPPLPRQQPSRGAVRTSPAAAISGRRAMTEAA
jgi:hypothetical protein